ncbi:MAG: asparagine synthetase [Gemmatimonadetes bacterium]|nr:asparagine synthetase [Gemmatimonadota bacterium]
MAPRGPDGAGTWVSADERVALGHRRLAIIDLSDRGAQPMRAANDAAIISFNGEIYNYRALRTSLEQRGYRFSSDSDTEVLLHLYADRGDAMFAELRGMFAFALWDSVKGELVLARDPFGIKPLYYADDGSCVRAASEVKALRAGGAVDTSPEPAGHVGFFLWGHVPEPYTLHRGIRSLEAGTVMRVTRDGRKSTRTFASVRELLSVAEANRPSERDAAGALRDALVDSVKHHLVADVDVAVFLSAGLDSATILGLAAETGAIPRTITLGFDEYRGTAQDETATAEAVAAHYGAEHRTVWITRETFEADVETLIDRMDSPSTDGINSYFVAKAAAACGFKVALSGLGGDELFGGYPSFRDIPRLIAAVGHVPHRPAVGRAMRNVIAPILPRAASPKYAGLVEYGGDHASSFLLRRALFMPWELPSVLDAELVRDGLAELDTVGRLSASIAGLTSDHAKISALESTWYMRDRLLRDVDWAGMSHSVEVRVPLVDWTLWQAAAPFACAGMANKQSLARAVTRSLPANVLGRPKTGFAVPAREWAARSRGGVHDRGLRGWARMLYAGAA